MIDMFRIHDVANFDITLAKKIMVFTLINDKTIKLRCYTSNIPSAADAITSNNDSNTEEKKTETTPMEDKKEEKKAEEVSDKKKEEPTSVSLLELGPSVTFSIRRSVVTSEDLYKESFRRPKAIVKKEKKEKNIEHNELGQVLGRLHVQQQDLKTLSLLKRDNKVSIISLPNI